jgi:hypothetical protein
MIDGHWARLRFVLSERFSKIKGFVTKPAIIFKNPQNSDTTTYSGGKLIWFC